MADTTTGRVAVHQLEEAHAGLGWKTGGLERVAAVLSEDLSGGHGPRAVEELLRLMSVLRNERNSAPAADALGDVLRAHPLASALVRSRLAPAGGIDRARSFAHSEGRAVPVRAPTPSRQVPSGALPLRALIDPLHGDRARARQPKPPKGTAS